MIKRGKQFQSDFERALVDPVLRRELAREGMIVEATEAIAVALEQSGISRAELARRLGRHRSFVTRLLSGPRNLTVATVGEVLDALGFEGNIELRPCASGAAGDRRPVCAYSQE